MKKRAKKSQEKRMTSASKCTSLTVATSMKQSQNSTFTNFNKDMMIPLHNNPYLSQFTQFLMGLQNLILASFDRDLQECRSKSFLQVIDWIWLKTMSRSEPILTDHPRKREKSLFSHGVTYMHSPWCDNWTWRTKRFETSTTISHITD